MKARLGYGFIDRNRDRWPVRVICRGSRSEYRAVIGGLGFKDGPTRDKLLSVAIKDVLDEHLWNDNYGARRMQLALAQRGIQAGIRRLTRLMWKNGWLHERKRRPKGLAKSDPAAMKAENLINQDFSAEKPF